MTHEVLPVISGYRIVLTYNLTYTAAGAVQTASTLSGATDSLRKLLAFWRSAYEAKDEYPEFLAYLLRHKYTDAQLSFRRLKGRDQLAGRCLTEACAQEGFALYLANLKRTVSGGCEENDWSDHHSIIDECDDEIILTKVVDVSGAVAGQKVRIEEDDIVQAEPFACTPDDEDYEGYTGNEGVSVTHYYRYSVCSDLQKPSLISLEDSKNSLAIVDISLQVFVIMPKVLRPKFFFSHSSAAQVDPKMWIQRLMKECEDDESGERKEELSELCDAVISKYRASSSTGPSYSSLYSSYYPSAKLDSSEGLGMVVQASFQLQRPELLQSALAAATSLPQWVYPEIGKGLRVVAFTPMIQGK